jgi:hypothetical protein
MVFWLVLKLKISYRVTIFGRILLLLLLLFITIFLLGMICKVECS